MRFYTRLRFVLPLFLALAATFPTKAQSIQISDADYGKMRGRMAETILSETIKQDTRLKLPFLTVPEMVATLRPDGSWPEIDYASRISGGWEPNAHLQRILRLALAWRDPNGEPKAAPAVHEALHRSLGYWLRTKPRSPNWYHNDINTPRTLGWILSLLGDDATGEELTGVKNLMQSATLNSKAGYMTGANTVSIATCVIMRGILFKIPDDIIRARQAIENEIRITTEEGIQPDASFHQHGAQQQFGTYGSGYAENLTTWMRILSGTPLAFSPDKVDILRDYILNGLSRVVWKDRMDISAMGRQLFGGASADKAGFVEKLLRTMVDIDPDHAGDYQQAVADMSAGTPPEKRTTGISWFWRSDYMVDHRADYYASVKMNSLRTVGTEVINKENINGAFLADGALYVYRHGREYEDIFPVWNWRDIPGVTSINRGRTLPSSIFSPRNPAEFVGGVTDGVDGIAVMDYSRSDTVDRKPVPIAMKKSWFFFDGQIVCLGTGITATLSSAQQRVTTCLNQCLLNGPVRACTDGKPMLIPDRREIPGLHWAWHDGIGYYFPEPTTATVGGLTQKGSWNNIYDAGSKDPVEKDVFLCRIDHGKEPRNAAYAYVLLPGISENGLTGYVGSPSAAQIVNTPQLQAVRVGGITALVFYGPGGFALHSGDSLSVNQPCLLLIRQGAAGATITVSDPTQKLTGLQLKWNNRAVDIALPQGPEAGRSTGVPLR